MLVVKPKMLVMRLKKVAVEQKLLARTQRLACVSLRGGWKVLSTLLVLLMRSKPSYFLIFMTHC